MSRSYWEVHDAAAQCLIPVSLVYKCSLMSFVLHAILHSLWNQKVCMSCCQVEDITSPLLLIQGEDDKLCVPQNATRIVERMQANDRHNYRLRLYPKAGHLIEPPYSPLCTAAWHRLLGAGPSPKFAVDKVPTQGGREAVSS